MRLKTRVSTYLPEERRVQIADHRTEGFIESWACGPDRDLKLLVRSAYLQGLTDMAEVAAKMLEPKMPEEPADWEDYEA